VAVLITHDLRVSGRGSHYVLAVGSGEHKPAHDEADLVLRVGQALDIAEGLVTDPINDGAEASLNASNWPARLVGHAANSYGVRSIVLVFHSSSFPPRNNFATISDERVANSRYPINMERYANDTHSTNVSAGNKTLDARNSVKGLRINMATIFMTALFFVFIVFVFSCWY
jgi:hypothetical protein